MIFMQTESVLDEGFDGLKESLMTYNGGLKIELKCKWVEVDTLKM